MQTLNNPDSSFSRATGMPSMTEMLTDDEGIAQRNARAVGAKKNNVISIFCFIRLYMFINVDNLYDRAKRLPRLLQRISKIRG
jgi:hypothetical protein